MQIGWRNLIYVGFLKKKIKNRWQVFVSPFKIIIQFHNPLKKN